VACQKAIEDLPKVLAEPSAYHLRPPFIPDPARTGWELLATALGNRLQRQLWKHDDLGAVETFHLGLRFGFEVAGGDAADVAVGLPIVDQLRSTLAAHLLDLSPGALKKLTSDLETTLPTFPPGPQNAENERQMMLREVQAIQDAYRDNQLEALEAAFQPQGHDLLHALETLHERDDVRRKEFFEHLAAAGDAEADWISASSRQPAIKRLAEPVFKPSARRPWQALAHYLFGAGGPMLRQRDLTLARTRLLYLNALALYATKTVGTPSDRLPTHAPSLVQDPYSGDVLHYVLRGKTPLIYSVGTDGLDNGGETDAALLQPDLRLESSSH
jgi:hypothetical protein